MWGAKSFSISGQEGEIISKDFIYIYSPAVTLSNVTPLNNFLLDVNFDKSTVGLHFLLIPSIPAKSQDDQRSINISFIKCLNFNFMYFKIMQMSLWFA